MDIVGVYFFANMTLEPSACFFVFFYWIIRDVQGVETFFQRVFLEVILFSDATNFFDLFAVIIFEAAKKYSVDSRALHFQFRRIIERAEQ